MNIEIIRSKRKSLTIQVRNQKVLVKAPLLVSDQVIDDWIKMKTAWIQSKLYSMPLEGFQTDFIYLFGIKHRVEIHNSKNERVEVLDERISIFCKIHQRAEKVFSSWVQLELSNHLEDKVSYYCELLGIEKAPFIMRKYTRMHGRCNSKGELGFNKYLYHYSYDFIDYVVLHECAHLIEFNHSKKFYEIINKHMPGFQEIIASTNFE